MKTRLSVCIVLVLLVLAAPVVAADLADLATVVDRTSHRDSSFDRTGGNNDNIMSFAPGQSVVLLDTDGPGIVTHMWFTVSEFRGSPGHGLRDLVLRIYWEGSKVPSVEAPLGDFFGMGHGRTYPVKSLPINVGANPRAMNCYWPMPFYKHARMEIVNTGKQSIRRIYFNIDYELGPIPPNQGLFHAEFRSIRNLAPQMLVGNTHGKDNYVILDTKGEGQYVGCFLFVDSAPGGWWGEGDEMMFIDGEEKPSIVGTGTEDYFCEAWGFARVTGFPFYGLPLLDKRPDGWKQTSCYRFHIPDPVRFKKSIRVTIEHGWHGKVKNDYSSMAYWYQTKPVASRSPLPAGEHNQPRNHEKSRKAGRAASIQWSAYLAEVGLREKGVAARAMTAGYGKCRSGGYLQIDSPLQPVDLTPPLLVPGKYHVQVRLLGGEGKLAAILVAGEDAATMVKDPPEEGEVVDLGEVAVGDDGRLTIKVRSEKPIAIDYVLAKPVKK
jgi:hypothetical protein